MLLAAEGGSNKVVENSVSIVFLKDPTDLMAKRRRGQALPLDHVPLRKGANQKDVYHVYGMAVAYEFARVLKAAGKNPTRAAVMAQTPKAERPVEPVPAAWHDDQDERGGRFPIDRRCCSAGRRELEELRRALGLSSG